MEIKNILLETSIANNQLWQIGLLFGILLLAMLIGRTVKFILNRQAIATANTRPILSSGYRGIARAMPFLLLSVGLQAGIQFIHLGNAAGFVETTAAIIFTVAVACVVYCLAEVPTLWLAYRASKTEGKLDDMLAPIIGNSLRVTIIILAIVQIAQIISGKEITSILAGLGIGGLAVALAAQDTLRNFFGSIVLLIDKPFEIGDRINIDGHDGPVESVGLRSTRIRTLEGHLVSIPNGELANKAIWNIAKRPHIRRIFNIGITYETPLPKVNEAKSIIEEVLRDHPGMHPDYPPRVYFNNFNDSSLNLFAIYWFHPAAYWDYMQFSDQVNTAILERFNEAGIEFAYPTQTLHLANQTNLPGEVPTPPTSG